MVGVFENDLIYGRVFSVPRPSEHFFDHMIQWYMPRLPDEFPISPYPLCTSVANTNALKLTYIFTEPRAQLLQRQGRAAAPSHCKGCHPPTRSRKITGVPLIAFMKPVIVPYINTEDVEE